MSGIHTDPLDSYNEGRIEQPLGVYSPADGTYIVDIYKDRPPADMVIKFDCPYDDFIALWLDGELLRRDEHLHVGGGDYYAEEGSTVVTVYGQTLGRLDPDLDHVIAAEFKEGGRVNGRQYKVAQNFRINRAVPEPKKVVHWYRVLRNEAYEKLEKLSDKDFKQITGVSRKVFCRMLEVLRHQYSEDHRQGGQLGLPVELRLTLALEYWREYRSLRHMANDHQISKTSISRAVVWVEDVLSESPEFKLRDLQERFKPGEEEPIRIVLIDVEEQPVERPKHNQIIRTRSVCLSG